MTGSTLVAVLAIAVSLIRVSASAGRAHQRIDELEKRLRAEQKEG